MYDSRGFVAHHNTDIWGDTVPQDTYIPATYWVMGGAWLCLHVWEHFLYSNDKNFLDENFVLLHDSCQFFVDYLFENASGEYVISPTASPENSYITDDGNILCLSEGCTMDSQILSELFLCYIQAAEYLNKERQVLKRV